MSTDTWYYAKRCFVSLFEILAKQMLLLKDASLQEILDFFDAVDQHGKNVVASVEATIMNPTATSTETPAAWGPATTDVKTAADYKKFTNNAAYEARRLKSLYLSLY